MKYCLFTLTLLAVCVRPAGVAAGQVETLDRRASIGSGGAELRVTTVTGRIQLRQY